MTTLQRLSIQVEDHLERRIRKPFDLLRCLVSCIEIVALALLGVAASATTTGIAHDIVAASRRLPHAVQVVAPPLALFALLILPVALAVRELLRRQSRRLAEAVATGLAATAVMAIADAVLSRGFAARLHDAIIMANPGTSHATAFDPYLLAGVVAYATIIGLSGHSGWRNSLWAAVAVYAIVHVGTSHTTVLSLLITLIAGRAIGLAVRYFAGSMSQRPSAGEIAAALTRPGREIAVIRRVPVGRSAGSRHYDVATREGDRLDVAVYDRDQQAAGAIYRLYRAVRVRNQVSRQAPLSVDRAVERQALLAYAAEDAGAPTPRLRAALRVGPEATVLAYDHHDGTTLAARNPGCTDDELRNIWDAVRTLHAHRVTHRALTADCILLTGQGQVVLLDPGDGDVAASDLQVRLDTAQLIAELALTVGTDRAAGIALEKVSASELLAVVPLLQPVALARSTRAALRRRRDVLPALRKRLLAAVPGGEVTPIQLERIRFRTLLTLVATLVAAYLLAVELGRATLASVLGSADWRWGVVALLLEGVTFLGATLSLQGFVATPLSFVRTALAQIAGSFVRLLTPAAVGGAALNIRYLQRRKIPAAVAAASVGVWQAVAFVLHVLLLVIFVAITGTGRGAPLKPPPTWSYFVLAGLGVVGIAVLAIPASRRLIRARAAPMLGQVLPRLLEVAHQPRKLAKGIGGALLLSAAYILCLAACVAAFRRSVPIASIAVVYLTGSAFGSIMPTPGGLGAVELAMTAGLTAAGVPPAGAGSSVLLFRLLTFWLPVPVGWVALNYLERQQALLAVQLGDTSQDKPGMTVSR